MESVIVSDFGSLASFLRGEGSYRPFSFKW